jgi:2-polyprenyl-3-methyl-5-hydroxy-6-metoxy-1,4-benzoquinol methylase
MESCRGVLEAIQTARPDKGRLLDLGCGPGFLLKAAQEAGWAVAGVDVSEFATTYAREQFGISEVLTSPLEKVEFPAESFDVVTLQHVIEHFRDPAKMVERIRYWLKSGGLLWIETPDIDSGSARRDKAEWEHIKIPEHLFYFSERTLRKLLHGSRFKVLSVRRPVEGTGLLEAACGGCEEARRFYEHARKNPVFRMLIRAARYANEFFRARLKGESDVVQVLAEKVR